MTTLATDPFDYAATDVRVRIVEPGGVTNSLPAFFDGGTTWRVRHTPGSQGTYQAAGVTLNGMPLAVSDFAPGSWTVAGRPNGPGFVRVDPANPSRFITEEGRRYYPLGHNVGWWTNNTIIPYAFHKMGAAHENWSRVWMTHFYDTINLEWPAVGALGQYNLTAARKWDAIVEGAEQSGVRIQVVLQHHGQYSTTVNPNWDENPYNSARGGILTSAEQFFTDATAKALTKRKYRYIVARWGYSPAIMAWELFNEVQFTDAARNGQWAVVGAWHDEMAQFLRSQDPYSHLVTTSSDLDQPIWNQCDYYQHHVYPSDLIVALRNPPGVPAGQPIRPLFEGECDLEDTAQLGVNGPVWASVMAAQSGNGQPWWWDRIDPYNEYGHFRAVADFVSVSGLADQDGLAKSAPHVTCPVVGPLTFAPGGGWATASQDVFTVGDATPEGIGTLPSFLQGRWHREMTPSGYTFLVDYPQAGTFSVQVLESSTYGDANLRVNLDGITRTNRLFPYTNAGPTNVTLSIPVTAGAHTIVLTNAGLDWVVLGNLTFDPYAPMLAAYQIGNSTFAAVWLWHRTNLFNASATATLNGSFPLAGLRSGSYAATWWDTFAGAPFSNLTFSVSGTDPLTVAVPSVLRSIAFFAGPAAKGEIVAPPLTHVFGSNSPPVTVPLTITNRGGLPLAWSLSLTGASPVIYAGLNSTQTGGPAYAWMDISSVGRGITNFARLTAKDARDEGIAGPVPIGFGFPFFSGGQSPDVFADVYISPNGFITFSPFAGDTSVNRALPGSLAPSNCIAVFWDDLDLSAAGRVYCATDAVARTFTVQYQDARIKGTSANVTCQAVLKPTGEIVMQYKTIGRTNTCTVGLQDTAQSAGLQLAWNSNYLQSVFAVRLSPSPWLDLEQHAGLVPKGSIEAVNLTFSGAGLPAGTYTVTLLAQTADPELPLTVLPCTLHAGLAAPRITSQPQSLAGVPGGAAAFSISADGSPPLSYQWRANGVAIPDQTNGTLTLANIQPADFATYTVLVTNLVGSVLSDPALLTSALVPVLGTSNYNASALTLGFATEVGPVYVLEYSTNLSAGLWWTLTNIAGSGSPVMITDPDLLQAVKFYRVRLQ